MNVLSGLRVVELGGIGPGPFCGMLLADLGADVIVVERPQESRPRPAAITARGKRSVILNLKDPRDAGTALRLIETADCVIEGLRPGVTERLGLGPGACRARRPSLVYGRMTGWGQDGPLAQAAGHDSNYLGVSGALWYAGQPGEPPSAPPTLIGDVGGALYLALGLVAAVMKARETGEGQVVDAAIVDTSAHMMNLLLSAVQGRAESFVRGQATLDGGHWAQSYRCADGKLVNVAALEPRFYRLLLERMGLAGDPRFADQLDKAQWPGQRAALAEVFASRPREEWRAALEGTDACFAPVLDPAEAAVHPHLAARGTYTEADGVLQALPAPRFPAGPPPAARPVPSAGEHTEEILREIGLTPESSPG